MTIQTNNIVRLTSELISSEKKERVTINKLISFSRKLKKNLLEDKDNIIKKRKIVENRSVLQLEQLKTKIPKKELFLSKKDIKLVEKIINLTKENIGKENLIRGDVKAHFERLTDPKNRELLKKIFKHVSGEEVLDKKELDLELKSIKIFHLIFHYIQEKVDSKKRQNLIIDSKSPKKLFEELKKEEEINNKLISLVNEILDIEGIEKNIEKEKTKEIKPMMVSHWMRNAAVLTIVLVLILFYGQNRFAAQELTENSLINSIDQTIITSVQIDESRKINIDLKTKTEVFNSLMQLYYYAKNKCSKNCILDESAINNLLTNDKKLKNAALEATQVSLENNVLKIISEKTISSKIPGSIKTATIYLENTEWSVNAINGDFEFNLIKGKAWLNVNLFGSVGGFFGGKRGDTKIQEMPNINKAILFKYTREDNSKGLYGVLYDENINIKNGIDLSNEDFSTVNKIPKKEEEAIILAFAGRK